MKDSREQARDRVHAFVFVYLHLPRQLACPVWCSVGSRATPIYLLDFYFVFFVRLLLQFCFAVRGRRDGDELCDEISDVLFSEGHLYN